MANTCDMNIIFYSDSTEKSENGLRKLHSKLSEAIENNGGRFTSVLNKSEYPEILMQGDFSYVEDLEENCFSAEALTAWEPMYEFLEKLCSLYGVSFASSSDESGFDIFQIYGDKEGEFFTHNYSIDIWGTDDCSDNNDAPCIKDSCEFFDTEQEMLDWLNNDEHYGTLFHSDSREEWEEFFEKYEAGHIRKWARV